MTTLKLPSHEDGIFRSIIKHAHEQNEQVVFYITAGHQFSGHVIKWDKTHLVVARPQGIAAFNIDIITSIAFLETTVAERFFGIAFKPVPHPGYRTAPGARA